MRRPPHLLALDALDPVAKRTLLVALGLVSLLLLWTVFELRYVWYVDAGDLRMLRLGIGSIAAAIVLLWSVYPSRLLVGGLGALGFLFPPVVSEQYVGLTPGFVAWALVVIGLLEITTMLRQSLRRERRSAADRG